MRRSADLHPLSAGLFGLAVAGAVIGAAAGVGIALGSAGIGVAVGAVLGIPLSIVAVVFLYRKRS
jgi:uncharacterized membrane protein